MHHSSLFATRRNFIPFFLSSIRHIAPHPRVMQKILPRCSVSLFRSSAGAALRATRIAYRSLNSTQNAIHPVGLVSRNFHQISRLRQEAAAEPANSAQDGRDLVTTFTELAERKLVSRRIVDTLTRHMNLHTMTEVQTATINTALSGKDLIAQAKTGTGKTLAFLLPIVQNVLGEDPSLEEPRRHFDRSRPSGHDIRALIISPTRELAEQIAVEAKALVRGTSVVVQTAVGGSYKREGLRRIQEEGCHILVGTPGRLEDILSDTYSGISAPGLNTLVLDEADRLLETGFAEAIKSITALLPRPDQRDRQTMMFSATVPKGVVRLVRSTLKPGFEFVQCVKDGEEPTHEKVPQYLIKASGFDNKFPALLELLRREAKAGREPGGRPFKAIVYLNSTAEVELYTEALREVAYDDPTILSKASVFGVQSRLTQPQRTRETQGFRACETGILVSSDVTARGLDFPDVTHVIQMAAPVNRDQYVHRIGRTGRAGKEGQGYLIMSALEMDRANEMLKGLPLVGVHDLETAKLDLSKEADVSPEAGKVLSAMQRAFKFLGDELKTHAYKSMLGVYTNEFRGNKRELIAEMNRTARYNWGMVEAPAMPSSVLRRLGLERVAGVKASNAGRFDGESRYGRDDARDRGRVNHSELNQVFGSIGAGDRREGGGSGRGGSRGFGQGGFGSGRREGGFRREGSGSGFREGGNRDGGFRSDRDGYNSRGGGRGESGRY